MLPCSFFRRMQPLRLAIVDDEPPYRLGLRQILERWAHGAVVVDADAGVAYEEWCAASEAPDIVLLSAYTNRPEGWATLERLRQQQPAVLVLVSMAHPTAEAVHRAFAAGANAVMPRSAPCVDWLEALDQLRTTGHYHNELAKRQLLHVPDPGCPAALRKRAEASLSKCELRFLLLYISDEELTVKAVGEAMGIKETTAESLRKSVADKTGARKRLGQFKFAQRFGLVDLR